MFGISFLLAGLNTATAQQYVISTFAGGVPLPTPAAAAQSQAPSPTGMASDSAGNIYFAADSSIFKISTNGVMTRIAGNARPGYSGDGGPASSAQINTPIGLAVDASGNVYVADSLNNRVRKVAIDGTIATVAGTGIAGYSGDGAAATSAKLSSPSGLAFDAGGNLYIADTGNHRVRKISTGTITTVAGNGIAAYSGDGGMAISASLNGPMGVTFDAGNSLYIADTGNYAIRKVAGGLINTIAGNGVAGKGTSQTGPIAISTAIGKVQAMVVDASGALYLGDRSNGKVWQVWGGAFADYWPSVFLDPAGLAISPSGNFYVSNNASSAIDMVTPAGTVTRLAGSARGAPVAYSGDGGVATSAHLETPMGLALDGAGNLYVADTGNWVIREVSAGGAITTVAGNPVSGLGTLGVIATNYLLEYPSAVAVDGSGDLFIRNWTQVIKVAAKTAVTSQLANLGCVGATGLVAGTSGNLYFAYCNQIQKLTPAGNWTVVAGNGTQGYSGDGISAISAAVNQPAGMALDASGNLYFADSGNHRVREITPLGVISTVAGNGKAGFLGDGGAAASAELNTPSGVAVDSAGNVYIADTGNNRIRKVSVSGTITTIAGIGTTAYSGDGGLATSAELNQPTDVVVDKAGNVYIADTANQAIRILSNIEPLTLAAATLPDALTGSPYSVSLAVTGGALPYSWIVSSGALPAGLTLSATGVVSGTPSVTATSNFTVQVMDAGKSTAAQAFHIRVVSPLSINSTPAAGIVGASYSQTLTASGGTPPYSWALTGGALPAGFTLSPAGVLSGTPIVAGVANFTLQVTDSDSLTATQTFNLLVVNSAPVIATTVVSAGVTGVAYSQTLSAIGGNPPYTWSGTLPAGLVLSANGLISGMPTTTGSFNFSVGLTDSAGLTANQAYSIAVIDGTALARNGVLPNLLTGGGWTTAITFTNTSPNPIDVLLQLHGDDGSVLLSSATAAVPAGSTLTMPFGDPTAPANTGWVDILSSGSLTGSAVFQLNGNPQGQPVPFETAFETEVDVPYDNTGTTVTEAALVNLSPSVATITAIVLDPSGAPIYQQQLTIAANGHASFVLANRFSLTAGQLGTVKFLNPAGGNLAGLILQLAPDGTLTASPVTLP